MPLLASLMGCLSMPTMSALLYMIGSHISRVATSKSVSRECAMLSKFHSWLDHEWVML